MFSNFTFDAAVPGYINQKLASVLPLSSADKYDLGVLTSVFEQDEVLLLTIFDLQKRLRERMVKEVVFIHTNIHTYIHTYIRAYIHTCVHMTP
jgi:hypothetical protein